MKYQILPGSIEKRDMNASFDLHLTHLSLDNISQTTFSDEI